MPTTFKLAALVAVTAATLVPVAGGATQRAQRVVIESRGSVFAYTLESVGAGQQLPSDAGKVSWTGSTSHKLTRDGQSLEVETILGSFAGKRGRFDARFRIEWTSAGNGFRVGSATWTVRAGTGAYASLTGEGRSTTVIRPGGKSTMRAEGLFRP
jgi:hypothetical protein